jgi:hypothetical protein
MAPIVTTLRLTRLDKDLNKLGEHEQTMRSWIKHFFDLLYVKTSPSDLAMNDINGTSRTIRSTIGTSSVSPLGVLQIASTPGGCRNAVNPIFYNNNGSTPVLGENCGIVVGSNNAAPAPTDDAMGTVIAHGTGAGQLCYGGSEVLYPTFADPDGAMILRRYFTNSSGGDVTVRECGIYSQGCIVVTTAYGHSFCVCHDNVNPAVVVADTEILVVTYTLQITV